MAYGPAIKSTTSPRNLNTSASAFQDSSPLNLNGIISLANNLLNRPPRREYNQVLYFPSPPHNTNYILIQSTESSTQANISVSDFESWFNASDSEYSGQSKDNENEERVRREYYSFLPSINLSQRGMRKVTMGKLARRRTHLESGEAMYGKKEGFTW